MSLLAGNNIRAALFRDAHPSSDEVSFEKIHLNSRTKSRKRKTKAESMSQSIDLLRIQPTEDAEKYISNIEHNLKKLNGVPACLLKKIGVVGCGFMGSAIVATLLQSGFHVTVFEVDQKALDRGVTAVKRVIENSERRGGNAAGNSKQILQRLSPTLKMADMANMELVIEAVKEDLEVKWNVFRQLDAICNSKCILCSNTSTINITQIAEVTKRASLIAGFHFFFPVTVSKLVEVIRAKETAPAVVDTLVGLARAMGKAGIVVNDCFGFVANRVFSRVYTEAFFMVEEGANIDDVDRVFKQFGFPKGPFELSDYAGIDVICDTAQSKLRELQPFRPQMPSSWQKITVSTPSLQFRNSERYSSLPALLVRQGRLGRKTGRGWYFYTQSGAQPDPFVVSLIRNHRTKLEIKTKTFTDQEIVERLVLPVVNEAFKILEDGIVTSTDVIDYVISIGYHFPRQYGGPMFWAQSVGLDHILKRIEHYYKTHPLSAHWQPSSLLQLMVKNGTGLDRQTPVVIKSLL